MDNKRFSSRHEHVFLGDNHDRNARRTWFVIALTSVMMIAEIIAGTLYGSMALVADGWHMSTHAAALLIAALAYHYARRNAGNPRYAFGTGKFGELAAFASAVILALVSLLIGWESLVRLYSPVPIDFRQAIAVACIGLAVNIASALLLRESHPHSHPHRQDLGQDLGHDQGHDHGGTRLAARDNNLRAAYLHIVADAFTSVLAIVALMAGRYYGWVSLDPATGMVGALVIARWSWSLMCEAGGILVDYVPPGDDLPGHIRSALQADSITINDLHVWQIGPGHHAAIISLSSPSPKTPADYKARLSHIHELAHITIEIETA